MYGSKFNIHVHVQWGLRGEGYRTLYMYMHEICAIPACTLTAFCFTRLVHRRGARGVGGAGKLVVVYTVVTRSTLYMYM